MTSALIFVLFLAPTIQYRIELGAFSLALMEPIVILASALLLFSKMARRNRIAIPRDPLVLSWAGMILWAIMILPWAPDLSSSLSDIRNWTIPFLSMVALISTFRKGWRKCLAIFLALATANSILGIYQHHANAFRPFVTGLAGHKTSFALAPGGEGLAPASYAVGFFSHPNDFAMYLFLGLMVAVGWPAAVWKRLLRASILLILLLGLVWTYAKASLAITLLILLGIWMKDRVRCRGQLVLICLMLILGGSILGWALLRDLPPTYLATLRWRINLWHTALEVFGNRPAILLIGNGIRRFAESAAYPQPHSLILYIALSYGVPGLCLVLGMIFHLLRQVWPGQRLHIIAHETLLRALWLGLLGYFAIGLVESNLMGMESRMLFSLVAACFVGLRREMMAQNPEAWGA